MVDYPLGDNNGEILSWHNSHLSAVHVSHQQLQNARLDIPYEYHRVLGGNFEQCTFNGGVGG